MYSTAYYSNYYFVEHVLKMDTIFPDSNNHYRSIDNPIPVQAGYIVIIILEILMTFFCLKGAWMLIKNLKREALSFHENKKWLITGLIIAITIWFFGFEVIGGEWFTMWQSSTWNGLGSADRITTFIVLILILFQFKEEELPN